MTPNRGEDEQGRDQPHRHVSPVRALSARRVDPQKTPPGVTAGRRSLSLWELPEAPWRSLVGSPRSDGCPAVFQRVLSCLCLEEKGMARCSAGLHVSCPRRWPPPYSLWP